MNEQYYWCITFYDMEENERLIGVTKVEVKAENYDFAVIKARSLMPENSIARKHFVLTSVVIADGVNLNK